MIIVEFLDRLLRRTPTLPNGYPDVAQTVSRRINGGQQPRWNAPGGFLMPPPPPIPQQDYYLPNRSEPIQAPMVSETVNKIKTQAVRITPSPTSSLSTSEYFERFCGTTVTDIVSTLKKEKDPYVVDHLPLKRMLMKTIPWIIDVTEVKVKKFHGTGGMPKIIDGIMSGQLEIYITVSPTHHSELMNPKIEVEVREKLFVDLLPLLTCMYPNNSFMPPVIIFSPLHSETILEHVK